MSDFKFFRMEDLQQLLENMTKMKQGMENMQNDLQSYVMPFSENGISLNVHGDGVISELKFPQGTSPCDVEKVINNANAQMKEFITQRMNNITPSELLKRDD